MESQFERYGLDERIVEKLPKLGYKRPTPVQHAVIPLLMQKKNLIVEAPTGSGKTAAYGLPCISKIDINKRSIQALILVPSRELARQVEMALKSFSTQTLLKVEAVYGGSPVKEGVAKVASHPHILIAVPGRLRDILRDEKFPYFWRNINFFVIDEADRLLEQGFQHEVFSLLPHLKKGAQVSLYSATLTPDIEALGREKFDRMEMVRLWHGVAWRNIHFNTVIVPQGKNEHALVSLIRLREIGNALIFCNKREEVYSLSRFMRANAIRCEAYHGLMDQVERDAVMHRFKLKQVHFLIATDLAARGLDVVNLEAVINFSLPDERDIYLHRVGRTGRAGRQGEVYNLITSSTEKILLKAYHDEEKIQAFDLEISLDDDLKTIVASSDKIVKLFFDRGKKDKLMKGDVLGFLSQACALRQEEIGTIAIYESHTLVDVPQDISDRILATETAYKIKGKSLKIRKYGLDEEKARTNKVKKLVASSKERAAKKTRGEIAAMPAGKEPVTEKKTVKPTKSKTVKAGPPAEKRGGRKNETKDEFDRRKKKSTDSRKSRETQKDRLKNTNKKISNLREKRQTNKKSKF